MNAADAVLSPFFKLKVDVNLEGLGLELSHKFRNNFELILV